MKKIIRIISLILMLSVALCACSSNKTDSVSKTDDTEDYKNGGSIKMGCVPVDTLNPLITVHSSVADFLSLVYEGLFVAMPDLTAQGVLATEYVASDDNTVYTIRLKNGVTFHNGKPFGAEDVVATLSYISMYGGKYSTVTDNIAAYNAPSNDTVIITLKTPVADFANTLDFPILPSGLTADDFAASNAYFVPVGTGMYAYDSAAQYKNIYLKANTSWHNPKKRPHIDKIDVEILSDEDTVISAFDAGAIDIITTSWRNGSEMNLTSSLYKTYETSQNKFTFMGINTASAAFDTASERRAFASKIDVETLCDDIMLGGAESARSPVREGVYFNSEDTGDKKTAQHETTTADEINEDYTLMLLYNSSSKTKERLALALKHRLSMAGLKAELDPQPFELYLAKVANCEYDLYVGEVSVDNAANLEFMFGEARSYQNVCCYQSTELATLVSNLNRMSGKQHKSVAWENFEKYYYDNAFQVPLYFTKGAVYVNKTISGDLKPNLSSLLYGFEELYIENK